MYFSPAGLVEHFGWSRHAVSISDHDLSSLVQPGLRYEHLKRRRHG
jgi:hypothetical protein